MSVDSRVALCGREEEEERKRLGAREGDNVEVVSRIA